MNEPKFTPGPWTVADDHFGLRVIDSDERDVALFTETNNREEQYNLRNDYAENQANARLIAAAPEMAEALQSFVAWLRYMEANKEIFGDLHQYHDRKKVIEWGEKGNRFVITLGHLRAADHALSKAGLG